jgi:hypothetical protein
LFIKKSAATPTALRALQGRPVSSYSDLGEEEGLALRTQLCEEQGRLCAYCMSRIDERAATGDQHLGSEEHPRRLSGCSIEHLLPQSEDASAELLWSNMVAVCSGRRVWEEGAHCDKARGATALPQLNPLSRRISGLIAWRTRTEQVPARRRGGPARPLTVLAAEATDKVAPQVREEIEADIETLRLNVVWLGRNRHDALADLRLLLLREQGEQVISRAWIDAQRRRLTTPDERGRLPEYAGVLLWQLERWERKAR